MDSKRSVTQSVNKVPPSKTSMIKTKSEVSLTPSQMAEMEKQNARKNPLDALSRTALRSQGFERRSGLQDVDEEYLKKNVFSKPLFHRNSGLGDAYAGNVNPIQANTPQMANTMPTGAYGDSGQISQTQAHMYTPQQAQQQQAQAYAQMSQPAAGAQMQQAHGTPPVNAHAHGHAHAQHQQAHLQQAQQQQMQQQQAQQQYQQQQQQQYQQQPQYQQQQHYQQQAQGQQQAQYQQQQAQQQKPPQQQQYQQVPPAAQQQQQVPAPATNPAQAQSQAQEPDMCTTCPNCQTTIYLVRGNEAGFESPQTQAQQ